MFRQLLIDDLNGFIRLEQDPMLFVHEGVAEVKTLDVPEYLSINVSTAENQDFRVVEGGCVATAPVGVLARWVDSNPSVQVNVEQVDVHKNSCWLATTNHTKVRLIHSCSCVACSWSRWLLSGHRWQEPAPRCDIENEHIIKELVNVPSGEHIEVPIRPQITEIYQRTTGAGCRHSH